MEFSSFKFWLMLLLFYSSHISHSESLTLPRALFSYARQCPQTIHWFLKHWATFSFSKVLMLLVRPVFWNVPKDHIENFGKKHIKIPEVLCGAWESTFVANFQVVLMLWFLVSIPWHLSKFVLCHSCIYLCLIPLYVSANWGQRQYIYTTLCVPKCPVHFLVAGAP